jgi:uncharacterized damage-inducible protein DinB
VSLSLSLEEFLGFTNGERARWEKWFSAHPRAALEASVQREARFPTVWGLIDHIFIVEKRHTQRLEGVSPLAEETGVAAMDAPALFAYGRAARQELSAYINSLSDAEAGRVREFRMLVGTYSLTPRKLLFHIQIHEVRHWAQIAAALRNAGFEPPGEHDLLFSSAMQ